MDKTLTRRQFLKSAAAATAGAAAMNVLGPAAALAEEKGPSPAPWAGGAANLRMVTEDLVYLGADDRRLALFENIYPIPRGVSYNSYLLLDEKTVLFDTVDKGAASEFFANLSQALAGRKLDYFVVNHMEPDHAAGIGEVLSRYPEAQLICSKTAVPMIQQFFGIDVSARGRAVAEMDSLSTGKHELVFVMAPMVHWPEVMFTYEAAEGILFSADAFGTFGGFTGNLFSDQLDYKALYLDETRRYYANIVGKYGPQVLAALKRVEGLPISLLCPLHGPVLRGGDIPLLLEKYARWAAYRPEKPGVVLAYASMYGNTEAAVQQLAGLLSQKGIQDLRIYDVSKTHCSFIIARAFQYSHLVLASPTYNMQLYQGMETLVDDMARLNLQNRGAAVMGNGSWAPAAHTLLQEKLAAMKNMDLVARPLVIRSALGPEQKGELEDMAEALAASVREGAAAILG